MDQQIVASEASVGIELINYDWYYHDHLLKILSPIYDRSMSLTLTILQLSK